MCGWATWKRWRAGMQMGVQTCGCVDADGCKQKRKNERGKRKKTLTGGFWTCGHVGMWACGWACSRVGMRMQMAVNKKKKKTLTGCFERADGRVGMWACGSR